MDKPSDVWNVRIFESSEKADIELKVVLPQFQVCGKDKTLPIFFVFFESAKPADGLCGLLGFWLIRDLVDPFHFQVKCRDVALSSAVPMKNGPAQEKVTSYLSIQRIGPSLPPVLE